jgi:hypothetical protein
MLLFCGFLLCIVYVTLPDGIESTDIPKFPLEFQFNVTITAHQVPAETDYPPRWRSYYVYYDYLHNRARIDVDAGFEAAKVYIRRYDLDHEFMVRHLPIDDCKRSHMGDVMPYPHLPSLTYIDSVDLDGVACKHYVYDEEYMTRIHMYFDQQGLPVQLIQESMDSETQQHIPMLTYDYSDVKVGTISTEIFGIDNMQRGEVDKGSFWSKEQCDLHAGGFPFIHLWHHFVKA